jgi:hypothetical protein
MVCVLCCAVKASEADALAEAAVSFIEKGKVDKARDILYRALAHDEQCALAIYELGKLFQADGDTISAVDFLQKAILEMQNRPEYSSKVNDAKARLQTLNPYAGNFTRVFEEYADSLGQACKRSNDSVTCTEALNRVQHLHMAEFLPADRMPNIPKPARPIPVSGPSTAKTSTPAATAVPLEVERALKSAGWTTITGTWKKKSEGVYEVTDGRLETPKVNGAIKLTIDQGGSGSVSVFVRNAQKDPTRGKGYMGSSMLGSMTAGTGFGVTIGNDLCCKVFVPQGMTMTNDINYSFLEHSTPLVNLPRHEVMITVKDSELHILVDGKKEKNSFAKINKEGPFTVEVKGTMTIEDPKAAEY